jgi:hypothetical protein
LLTYSLTAYNPYEGWRATLTGTSGRMELHEFYSELPAQQESGSIVVFDCKGAVWTYDVPQAVGEHGGGDAGCWRDGEPDDSDRAAGSHRRSSAAIGPIFG